jgi:hypothetical protein
VALGHQSVSGQKSDRDSYKPWDPEKDPPNPFADLQWKVMINGEQKVKFGGVGNNKEAAMKVALGWARNHGYEREVQAGKIEVVQVQPGTGSDVKESIDDGRAYIKRLTRKRVDDSTEVRYHVIDGNGVTIKAFDDLNNAKAYLRANRDLLDKI